MVQSFDLTPMNSGSDTQTLTSSIFNYRYEYGRRYHAFRDGEYWSVKSSHVVEWAGLVLNELYCLMPLQVSERRRGQRAARYWTSHLHDAPRQQALPRSYRNLATEGIHSPAAQPVLLITFPSLHSSSLTLTPPTRSSTSAPAPASGPLTSPTNTPPPPSSAPTSPPSNPPTCRPTSNSKLTTVPPCHGPSPPNHPSTSSTPAASSAPCATGLLFTNKSSSISNPAGGMSSWNARCIVTLTMRVRQRGVLYADGENCLRWRARKWANLLMSSTASIPG